MYAEAGELGVLPFLTVLSYLSEEKQDTGWWAQVKEFLPFFKAKSLTPYSQQWGIPEAS